MVLSDKSMVPSDKSMVPSDKSMVPPSERRRRWSAASCGSRARLSAPLATQTHSRGTWWCAAPLLKP
eukprot:4598125-Pyramimonas_sp.AAC.1